MRIAIVLLAVVACTGTSGSSQGDAVGLEAAPKQDCTALPAECPYIQTHAFKEDMTHLKALYLCAAWISSCGGNNPIPVPPTPSVTGGSTSVPPVIMGGSSATGGTTSRGGSAATGGSARTGGAPATGGTTAAKTPCQAMCDNLAALGCPDGSAGCLTRCALNTTDDRFTQNLACRTAAKTKAAAQACGPASCR